ncbi:MAG TPA: polysaccharide biosynthesis tyrosine autokinase [Humibacter sp.]|nr:polysaccharide biosynthesis tyrosine autokinase [Humibacter sp.]
MDQRAFWLLMRRRWMAIVAFGLLGAIIGSIYALTATPQYVAESELFVAAVGADNTADLAQGSSYSQQQARNYAVVATRQAVLEPVVKTLGLDMSAAALGRELSVSVPLNTSLISISVTDTSPARAAAIANAAATSLTNVVIDLVPKRSDGTSPVRLETVQHADVPKYPSAPNARLSILIGVIAGLVLGIVLVLLRELVGAKVRTPDQVKEQFGLSVLGSVAYDRSALNRPIVRRDEQLSLRAEEFRQIRTNLHFVHAGDRNKVFVITSSVPGEGKSSTSVNLAAAIAASGSTVALIEADLRNPALGRYLDLEESIGLTTVLAGDVEVEVALQQWGHDGLYVMLAGQIPPNPSELLGSRGAENLITSLRTRFDVVIIDTPPLMPVTDAAIVARMFGGAILIVGCGKVEVHVLRKTIEALTAGGAPILGAIVNLTPLTKRERYQRAYVKSQVTRDSRARRRRRTAARFVDAQVAASPASTDRSDREEDQTTPTEATHTESTPTEAHR